MKKILCLVLALAMALSLVACGGSKTEAPAANNAPADAPAANDAAPAAAALKIGGIGPITGGAALYGQNVMNGAQLAVNEINAKGGLQLELNFQDDEHDTEKSVNAYNNLKDWGAQALVATVTTAPCLAVAPEAIADGYYMMTPSASAQGVADAGVFQMCFTDPQQGVISADYMSANKLGEKVGILFDSSDAYSSGIKDAFVAEAAVVGLEIVGTEAFTADSNTDFSIQLQNLQAAGADIVFVPFYYTEASIVLKQAADMGFDATFFGVDGMDGILGVENFDLSLAEGLYLVTPFSAAGTDEKTVNFVTAYQAAYGDTPSQFAADGYDCVYAIYEAAVAAGLDGNSAVADVTAALTDWTLNNSFDGLTGTGMTWDASHTVSKTPAVYIIENGVYAAR